ncbi:Uracil phosphoribosyltransferase [Cladobotryum mycophilum]|uniref:Uracil phosphoribosyltransferase n=1 Tax=Cladobotryum mycophilum TaxID=491253 RepID=A0ABR0SUH7_9HYPO
MAENLSSAAPALQCVGPHFKTPDQKPSATVSAEVPFDNVYVLPQTPQLIALLSMIRNKDTERADFIFYSNRIIRLLVEEGLNHLPVIERNITTPIGRTYNGLMFQGKICGVSIMRAGEAMEQGLRDCCRSVRIGKILIQRDEDTSQPKLFYDKLPEDIADRWVLLLDPMFATGGSATMAVQVLKARGVPEDRILFLNLIASPEGVHNFATKFPRLKVVTAFIDEGLDEKNYIVPGLGDFGDRFYTI